MKEPDLFDIMFGKACNIEVLQERNGMTMKLCIKDIQLDYATKLVRIILTPEIDQALQEELDDMKTAKSVKYEMAAQEAAIRRREYDKLMEDFIRQKLHKGEI